MAGVAAKLSSCTSALNHTHLVSATHAGGDTEIHVLWPAKW